MDHGAGRLPDCRFRSGHGVSVINLSPGGVLLETTRRVSPGASVELLLAWPEGTTAAAGGRVLRSSVSAVLKEAGVRYRAAIRFDRELTSGTGCPRGG